MLLAHLPCQIKSVRHEREELEHLRPDVVRLPDHRHQPSEDSRSRRGCLTACYGVRPLCHNRVLEVDRFCLVGVSDVARFNRIPDPVY